MAGTVRVLWTCLLFQLVCAAAGQSSRKRVYYVGIVEDLWDYAPSGKNLLNGQDIDSDEDASVFLKDAPDRIGKIYKKAMYREFTDGTYKQLTPLGDVMVVHLKNFATRSYSIHPHGVFYEKDAEGALYPDGTSGKLKADDAVPPGGSYTYRWEVRPEFAPTDDDANCLTWVYHSHIDAPKEINSGLIGALLTCKKGVLKDDLSRKDVDQDVILMFHIVDENNSWYLKSNMQNLTEPPDVQDEDFVESNLMHAINGYMFGNLPGLQLCQHRTVAWHLFGMGNEQDIHSVFFYGNTVLDRGHRTDVLSLFPATFRAAEMVPKARGKWLLACQVNDHLQAGMQGVYEVKSCGSDVSPTSISGLVRTHYLAAEKVLWNYAPSGRDLITNVSLTDNSASEAFFGRENGRIGGQYVKVVYREYTDDTFSTKKAQSPESIHLGILGPVLRAEEGDTLKIIFKNLADRNYSILPHGLHYGKSSEGASYIDVHFSTVGVDKPGSRVGPGESFTYTWQVFEGPSASDPSCIPYLYFSATDSPKDTSSGLVGPLLVCKKGSLTANGAQTDVDKEFFFLFSVMDENMSWYLDENINQFSNITTDPEDEDFVESNKMHAVNGLMYGNLPGLEMCAGSRVRWYTLGLGTEVDLHGVYFEGNTFKRQSTTRDTLSVFPHTTATVDMQPTTPGQCIRSELQSNRPLLGRDEAEYEVKQCSANSSNSIEDNLKKTVQYFVSAEEIEWDYSPKREWELEKHHGTLKDSPGSVFVEQGPNRIGSRYKKVVYREYTDETFKFRKRRSPSQKHLEILGPIIKAEVGETINVVFRTKPQGYVLEMTWDIPPNSGPGASDPDCITYAYYSTVDFIKVTSACLCKCYLDPDSVTKDEDFEESNMMHGINGQVYGNLQGLVMTEGQRVNWYLLGMGNEVDMHTVHFHAQTFTYKTDRVHRADVFDLFPGTFQTVEMVSHSPGTWLLHCHVSDHIHAGMETTYTIQGTALR
uniref:ferroxidase n=1 Tax=Neogobius melanostomus TaxID=47308 RepID=A0A8C6WLD8_9GOBI